MNRGTAKNVAEVVAAAGELVGRTRLQKTMSLLDMAGVGYGFNFYYYKFGPYSDDLAVSVDRAVDLGYIVEEECRAAWGGFYSIFRASGVDPAGEQVRNELIKISRDADAVALELAVTAAFLAAGGSSNAWQEVAIRKPEKSSLEKMASAKTLYGLFLEAQGAEGRLPAISKL